MALRTAQLAVGTTPVELTIRDLGGSTILITAPVSVALYIGNQNVTAATGFEIPAGGTLSLDLTGDAIYGVTASSAGTAYVLQTGV